jgi:hypothetical protein
MYMNKDKGFVPALVSTIIVGVLALSGSALFLSKDSKATVNNTIINNYKEASSLCAPSTAPWLEVFSPNGGEVYAIGQKITVKWKTCNADKAKIFIEVYNLKNASLTLVNDINNGTKNDGSEIVSLSAATNGSLVPGEYELRIYAEELPVGNIMDSSDGTFVINKK